MASRDPKAPSGEKTKYLGNHTYTFESGHRFEVDNSVGDRSIRIYHPSGTTIEILDNGVRITRIEADDQEFINGTKDFTVRKGDFNITVDGNIKLTAKGDIMHETSGTYSIQCREFRLKSSGGHFVEAGGDQTVQINGKTAHRTSGDRDETTGGTKTSTVNRDHIASVGNEYNQNVSSDWTINSGGQVSMISEGQMGICAGDILGIASAKQIQTNAETGTFIKDNYAINIVSPGSAGVIMWSKGYKAGVFSSDNDVRVGAGGKLLVETDGGSKIDTAALIPGAGKFIPS
jgi:hypothetical protein